MILRCIHGFWYHPSIPSAWWRHQMETFSALLTLCAGNSPVTGEFPSQRPVTRSFDVFFDLHLNKRLSKQQRRRWLEMPSRSLWRHCNGYRDDHCVCAMFWKAKYRYALILPTCSTQFVREPSVIGPIWANIYHIIHKHRNVICIYKDLMFINVDLFISLFTDNFVSYHWSVSIRYRRY